MPGWPDFQKVTAWTFPATLSAANINSNSANGNSDVTQTIATYTDGKVHVLSVALLVGTIVNTDTVNDHEPFLVLQFTRGFDNAGGASNILSARWRLNVSPTTATPIAVHFTIPLTQPILFQAGSVGTPNALQAVLTAGTTLVKWAFGWNVIDWAVT